MAGISRLQEPNSSLQSKPFGLQECYAAGFHLDRLYVRRQRFRLGEPEETLDTR